MSLLNLIRSEHQKSVGSAWERYRQLLTSDDTGDAKTLAEVKQIMATLGKSPADVEQDFTTIRRAQSLLAAVKDGEGLDDKRTAAAKAVEEHNAEAKRLMVARQQRLSELLAAESELSRRYLHGQTSRHDLLALKRQSPMLLMSIPVPADAGDKPAPEAPRRDDPRASAGAPAPAGAPALAGSRASAGSPASTGSSTDALGLDEDDEPTNLSKRPARSLRPGV